jgi:hypothetical protein
MDNPPPVDYVRVWPFNWMIGSLGGVGFVALIAVANVIIGSEAGQFAVIALLMIALSVFAYKTEVKRQEEEIAREQDGPEKYQLRFEAFVNAPDVPFGEAWPPNYALPKLRH